MPGAKRDTLPGLLTIGTKVGGNSGGSNLVEKTCGRPHLAPLYVIRVSDIFCKKNIATRCYIILRKIRFRLGFAPDPVA